METNSKIIIIRHPKERVSKCSLQCLKSRPEVIFHKAHKNFKYDATGHILLKLDAPVLSKADVSNPLLVLDSTWRLLPDVENCVQGEPIYRTLPKGITTAYPRISKIEEDPQGGLASIEALYVALKILNQSDESLLDEYYWKDKFLELLSIWESENYVLGSQ